MPFSTQTFSTGQVLTAAHMTSIFQNFAYLKGRSTDTEILLENTLEISGSLYFTDTTGSKFIQVERAASTAAEVATLGIDGYTVADAGGLEAGDAIKISLSVSDITGAGTTAESTSRERLGGFYAELDSSAGGGSMTLFVVNNAGSSVDAMTISSSGLVTFNSLNVNSTSPFPVNAQYLGGYERHAGLWTTGTLATPTTAAALICATTIDRTGTFLALATVQWQFDSSGNQGINVYIDDSTSAVSGVFVADADANAANDYGHTVTVMDRFSATTGQVYRLMGYLANSTAANPGVTMSGDMMLRWVSS